MSITYNLIINQLTSDSLHFGFKKHSGCCHALFTFKEVSKCFIKNGGKVYCAFFDASKAFDKVLHNGFFVKLLQKKEYLLSLCVFYRIGIANCTLQYCGMNCYVTFSYTMWS